VSVLSNTIAKAKSLTINNPKQQERIKRLDVLTKKKLTELNETIDLNMNGNRAEALELILTNYGKQLMDDIRIVIQEMHYEERQLLKARRQDFVLAIRWAFMLISFGVVLAFTIIGAVAILVGRDAKQYITQREQAEVSLIYSSTHDALTSSHP